MKFSYNWLSEYLKNKLLPQEMADLLTMHAFEVEGAEKFGNDFVLDIKVLPDRAHDCLSHIGIAKELAAISKNQFVAPKVKIKKDKAVKIKDLVTVEVKDKELCPRYSMMGAVEIKVGPSPKWMQERLSACGLRPISNIVDITNYVMLEFGQPLHAFDADKIGGPIRQRSSEARKKIIVRRAKAGEKIITLDEGRAERTLNENVLVIADEQRAIGIAGIKGGRGPEIDERTKNIVVEAASFNPTIIRRSSKALNLRTDASVRFENELDPELTRLALERCVYLFAEIAGGKIAQGMIDVYSNKIKPRKIFADVEWIQGLLGLSVKAQEMLGILKRLDIPAKLVKKGKKVFIKMTPPLGRLDLQAQEDLAEEIARLMGYDKIPAQTPSGLMIPAIKEDSLAYEDKIKDILVGAGWSEAQNYSFISDDDVKNFDVFKQVEIRNPFSNDQKYLRPTLVINLLKNVKENLKYFDSVRLFEVGHVFMKAGSEFLERNRVAAIVVNKNAKNPSEGLFELKGLIHILFEKLGIDDVWFDDAISEDSPVYWFTFTHPSRRAQVKRGDREVGWIGEIKPKTIDGMEIKEKIFVFELDLPELIDLASEERMYRPPSKYPANMRDLAVVVLETTKVEEILNVIETAGGELLADTDLFDMYEGLAGGKKSLAFHLTFQSDERNLTDAEVNKIMEKIIGEVEEKGWEIRK